MESLELVLIKAHLKTGDDVKLLKCYLSIIWLVAHGFSNKVIAEKLYMSINTLGHHITEIYKSTGAENQTELTVFAIDNDLVKKINGAIIKYWETNEIAWVWEKRKYGEMRSEE
ncbi:MAG TPA: LuxR C-terminal-related transcriptional regulator [Bacteroidia bacterium]|nr:LuxR C-terminal-related transcriptional regulator [Bacteroidia bacterium]